VPAGPARVSAAICTISVPANASQRRENANGSIAFGELLYLLVAMGWVWFKPNETRCGKRERVVRE